MKNCIKYVGLHAVWGLLAIHSLVLAESQISAEDLLKAKLNAVFTVLQNKNLEQQTQQSRIEEIVTPMFDFPLMAKLSLGRKHWSGLNQENKDRFTELFVKRLRQSYLNKIKIYTDEKIIYEPPVEVKKKIHVPTHLISKGKKISMLYKFYKSNDRWKIYDVEIQGVSIIRSYRSQSNEILQNGTFDDLLQRLEKPVNN